MSYKPRHANLRYVVPSRNANNFALEQGIIANLTLLISLQHPLQLKYTIILYAPSKMTSTQCIRVKIATGEKNRWRDRLCNALFWVLYVTFQVGQFSNLQLGQMKNCQASIEWPNFWNWPHNKNEDFIPHLLHLYFSWYKFGASWTLAAPWGVWGPLKS